MVLAHLQRRLITITYSVPSYPLQGEDVLFSFFLFQKKKKKIMYPGSGRPNEKLGALPGLAGLPGRQMQVLVRNSASVPGTATYQQLYHTGSILDRM